MDVRHRTKRTRFVFLGVLCALLALGGTSLRAQAPDETLTLEVIPAWEGYVRHSWWTEARVTLRNEDADWRGDLIIHDEQNQVTYRQAVELPSHSYKQYRLPLFVGNNATPSIGLHDTSEIVQQEKRVSIRGIDKTGRIIALADTREAVVHGQLAELDALIWLPDLAGLPETPMAWDVIDVLLLNGIPTADLTSAQQEALLAWVAAGGHLIVGGGPALQQTLAHLPAALRIAEPGSVRQFESVVLKGTTLYDVATMPLTPNAGVTPLATANGHIVAAQQPVGKGIVDIVGWDMGHAASDTWLPKLWAGDPLPAVSAISSDQAATQGLSSASTNVYTLFRIPFTIIPKFWPWLLLFPLYIFLMGPGTLLLVRHLKRPVLAWVFIPAWIFGAIVILAFGLSSTFSQTFPLVHEVAMVFTPDPALPARVVQGTAVYAPRIRRLTWTADGISRPLSGSYRMDTWYSTGDPFPVDARFTDAGTILQTRNPLGVITWGTEGLYDSPDIATNLKLTSQEGSAEQSPGALYLTGEIWSETALRNVSLMMGNTSYGITLTESITRGTAVVVSRPMTATYPIYGYSGYADSFCGVMNSSPSYSVYPSMPTIYNTPPATMCYLTGIMDGVPFPAQELGGIQHQESCIVYTIPCPTQPTGKITVVLDAVTEKSENGWIDTQTDIFYAYAPSMNVHFILPVYMQIRDVEALTLTLLPAPEVGTSNLLATISEISLWNWDKETWIDYPISESEQLTPLVLTGDTARQAYDAQQGVRVRISTPDGVTARLILTLEGLP